MAVLGIQWLLSTQLILDLPTMAASLVSRVEIGIVIVNLVRCALLPLVVFFIDVASIAIIAIEARVIIRLSLWRRSHMEVNLRKARKRN